MALGVADPRTIETIVRPNALPVMLIQDNRATVGFLGPESRASDFKELRKVRSAAMTDIAGLGDAAYTFRDEDGRFKVDVVKCEE